MHTEQATFAVQTTGRGFIELTSQLRGIVGAAGINVGLCNIFCQHTSASLIITENADADVRVDLETVFARLAPDGDPAYRHTYEGADDMPAHLRTVLTQSSISVPVHAGQLALGTWQGVYLWEHRYHGHNRQIIVTVQGE